ncbi:NB-ARC domain-containing protein [Kitasatospora sp. NPDC056531]|uniref:NB-ARC domain-containing protein n=1 Tax=Kitasatospora sp. NPDC056531 TaxID=3345856 RepID=UPI0036882407
MADSHHNQLTGGSYGGMVIQARNVNGVPLGGVAHAGVPPRPPVRQVGAVPALADAYRPRGLDLAAVETSAVVLTGMCGSGKTQVAAHHVHEQLRGEDVDFVLWGAASSRQAVERAYARAAAELGLAQPATAERFLAWLRTTDRRWLVVLDDLRDPSDLRALWPPAAPRGRTVVTTRRRDPSLRTADRQVLEVGPFGLSESVAYLADRLSPHGLTAPTSQLGSLAMALGHLPLALAQATAYLIDRADTGATVAGYLHRLFDGRPLSALAPDPAALPDAQEATLAAVLAAVLKDADAMTGGLAKPVLQLASVLAGYELLSADVLTPEAARLHYAATIAETRATPEAVHEALRTLHRLNLVTRRPQEEGWHLDLVEVHPLVQRAAHDSVPPGPRRSQLVELAALALATVWVAGRHDRETLGFRRANLDALTARHPEVLQGPTGPPLTMLAEAAALLTPKPS